MCCLSPAVSISKKRDVSRSSPTSRFHGWCETSYLFWSIGAGPIFFTEIADAFELALDERMGIIRAEVKSASPLERRPTIRLQQQLSRVSGKQVRCEFSIDPALIGGVMARIGSTVYDGSVRTQLQMMRERLVAH